MSTKTAKLAAKAFYGGKTYYSKNTVVKNYEMYLFGNLIAKMVSNGCIYITTRGWDTKTTLDRLNAIVCVSIYKERGQLMLKGIPWNGSWMPIIE